MSAPVPSVAALISRYPEFESATVDSLPLVQAALVEAAAETSDWAFPSAQNQLSYTLMKAAILLYNSPYAREMRLDVNGGAKVENMERLLYQKAVSAVCGLRSF